MAKTPEGWVKDQIKTILKDKGIYYHMSVTGGFGKSGAPDFICCVDGCFFTIEAKFDAAKNNPTPLQKKVMADIRLAGGETLVVDKNNYIFLAQWIDEPYNEVAHDELTRYA